MIRARMIRMHASTWCSWTHAIEYVMLLCHDSKRRSNDVLHGTHVGVHGKDDKLTPYGSCPLTKLNFASSNWQRSNSSMGVQMIFITDRLEPISNSQFLTKKDHSLYGHYHSLWLLLLVWLTTVMIFKNNSWNKQCSTVHNRVSCDVIRRVLLQICQVVVVGQGLVHVFIWIQ